MVTWGHPRFFPAGPRHQQRCLQVFGMVFQVVSDGLQWFFVVYLSIGQSARAERSGRDNQPRAERSGKGFILYRGSLAMLQAFTLSVHLLTGQCHEEPVLKNADKNHCAINNFVQQLRAPLSAVSPAFTPPFFGVRNGPPGALFTMVRRSVCETSRAL